MQQPPRTVAKEAAKPQPVTGEQEPNISEANANILAQKLVEFGYPTQDHLKLAEKILERRVKALADLNRSEAHAIFHHVQANHVQAKAA